VGLFFYIFVKPKKFLITKNLVITHKERYFSTILILISFFHDPGKITKEEE